jgi:hypothetical protein
VISIRTAFRSRHSGPRVKLASAIGAALALALVIPQLAAAVTVSDTTEANFNAGTVPSTLYVSHFDPDSGELILKPSFHEEFADGAFPSTTWTSTGTANGFGCCLIVDGGSAVTNSTFATPSSLEFIGTFGAADGQRVGFNADDATNAAFFGTKTGAPTQLVAHVNAGGPGADMMVGNPGDFVGAVHVYRIDYTTAGVDFYVDDNLLASSGPIPANPALPVRATDLTAAGPTLSVDRVYVSPYPGSGVFVSRVIDGGQNSDWGSITATASTPAGTGVALQVRTGDTPIAGGSTWTGFTSIASGADIPATSRYIQYAATLTTADTFVTPLLRDVSINYQASSNSGGGSGGGNATGKKKNCKKIKNHNKRKKCKKHNKKISQNQ